MNELDKVLDLAVKNGGLITTKDVVDNNLNKMTLKRLCDAKKLEKISTGYYCIPNSFVDQYYTIISKSQNAIFSHSTALFLHELSDRTPLYFDITVPRGYGGSLQNIDNVYLHYVDKNLIDLGMEVIKSPFDMDIKCYNVERTICDIIKDRNHMDKEIYTKALKWYANKKDKDVFKLVKYAKKLNIEDEVVEIMEVLL